MAASEADVWMRVLRNADAAGDTAAATRAAAKIKEFRSANAGRPTMASRDPNEVDPRSGKTRAQMESELATYDASADSDASRTAKRIGGDALRNTARGATDLAKGVIGLPGMVADIPVAAYNAIMGDNAQGLGARARQSLSPVELAPRNRSEEFGSTVTEGLGGVIGGMGPGSAMTQSTKPIVRNIGSVLESQPGAQTAGAVTSALAAEGAKELGGGPVAQTVASLAGGLVPAAGPLTAAAMERVSTRARQPQRPGVPSTDELAEASTRAYQRADAAGVVIHPKSTQRASDSIKQVIDKENLGRMPPKIGEAVSILDERASTNKPLTLREADKVRQLITDAFGSTDPSDRRIVGMVKDRYDDYLQTLGPQDTLAGRTPEALDALKQARALYRRKSNAEMVEEMVRRAEIKAGAKYTQAGMEHALRSEFKSLALNQKELRMFTPEQREAIERVAKGGPIENAMRNIGKFDPTQGGMSTTMAASLGGGVGFGLGGPVGSGVGAGVLSALGYVGRRGATRLTVRNVERAREALVGRGLPQTNRFAQLSPDEIGVAGDAFDAQRAAAASDARGSYDVTESPGEEITLQTPNRLRQLEPQLAPRLAARSAVATKTQSPRATAQIESEMQSIMKRSQALRADSPELIELDAEFSALQDELARAKQRSRPRNGFARLAGGE